MTVVDALDQLILGLILGALGQGIRVLIGLKKTYETSTTTGQSVGQSGFDGARLGISLLIGAIVGGLTVFLLSGFKALGAVDQSLVFKLVAVGYAGTDAIEGLLQKYLPDQGAVTPAPVHAVGGTRPFFTRPHLFSLSASSPLKAAPPGAPAKGKIDPNTQLQIELDVCTHVFPACATPLPGGECKVDANFPIDQACNAAPGGIAQEVDAYGDELARANSVKWGPQVVATDVSGLKTIQDLMNLVGKHLS
ncbi:MAG: hypothetical protein M0038_22730 [Pseudomonadota bacterium]|jgi:hypothetical protein|nr:hypothetical protein [Pseudomonadota bacterium]